jgi:hypothetical protein
MTLSETAKKAVDAYGGRDRWQTARSIEADVSVTGLAFTLKCRPFFTRARIEARVHRPFCVLTPIGRDAGVSGILDHPNVRLEDENGTVIARREDPRRFFGMNRRLFWWDDLDMAYFANYAFWNYFTLPALLLRADIDWQETRPGRLQACFPEALPTHSRIQHFTFDPDTGYLIQHDYTADIISRFARAANAVLAHSETQSGLVYPSHRRVTPRGITGRPLNHPILIDITVHDFRLIADLSH